jgi:hypothetical protein
VTDTQADSDIDEIMLKSDDSNMVGSINSRSGHLERQDSPPHPFLSMLGFDSFFFHQNDRTTGQLLIGISDFDVTMEESTATQARRDSDVECAALFTDNSSSPAMTSQDAVPDRLVEEQSQGYSATTTVTRTQCLAGGDVVGQGNSLERKDSTHNASSTQGHGYRRSSNFPMSSSIVLNAESVTQSVKKVGSMSVQGVRKFGSGTKLVGTAVKKVIQDVNADAVATNLKKVGTIGVQGVRSAGSFGVTSVLKAADFGIQNASAVVPIRINKEEGQARDAGFVAFNDLFTTNAARQMLQHPSGRLMTHSKCIFGRSRAN